MFWRQLHLFVIHFLSSENRGTTMLICSVWFVATLNNYSHKVKKLHLRASDFLPMVGGPRIEPGGTPYATLICSITQLASTLDNGIVTILQ